jgi:phosphopantothenoylcysteine decarboxylase / phosphopantothenate---cysteine ligase
MRTLLGVTGGIAAYKAAVLVRELTRAGDEVRVVMTPSATRFVAPLTFQALSGHPVAVDDTDSAASDAGMDHIALARWAERIVVAPASADFLARLRAGMANDLLTTLCLAAEVPLCVAPAMNRQMWQAAATQENVAVLAARGVHLLGPGSGSQACGEEGPGRMLEPGEIASLLAVLPAPGAARLDGLAVVVSAGPTCEPVDPVRFLGNRSSGLMGFALARAALASGAKVTLVHGPVALPAPANMAVHPVETAAQMREAIHRAVAGADIYIGAAAVADYTPATPASAKIRKEAGGMSALQLAATEDILAGLAEREPHLFRVGFAAETENLAENAAAKLARKRVHMLAANLVGQPGSGFGATCNAFTVHWPDGREIAFDTDTKEALAARLIALIAETFHAQRGPQDPGFADRD